MRRLSELMAFPKPWYRATIARRVFFGDQGTAQDPAASHASTTVLKELGSAKERLFGAAAIQFNAKLGQLVKAAEYEELRPELQEYATFMTQVA
ncbi:unnamed protein product [Nippostrongylus brasiliensis]|uniref:Acyl-CoA_dh_C domain-containing protein n=1 Tax=Nippostrongylus brasiliensis TaxID=27835 RepID=A0A0N4XN76_NIPBR|nr:unnamed protein product [Nippostrongylus brasiliensis]